MLTTPYLTHMSRLGKYMVMSLNSAVAAAGKVASTRPIARIQLQGERLLIPVSMCVCVCERERVSESMSIVIHHIAQLA